MNHFWMENIISQRDESFWFPSWYLEPNKYNFHKTFDLLSNCVSFQHFTFIYIYYITFGCRSENGVRQKFWLYNTQIQTSNLYNNKYHKAKSCVTSQHAGDKDKRLHTWDLKFSYVSVGVFVVVRKGWYYKLLMIQLRAYGVNKLNTWTILLRGVQ